MTSFRTSGVSRATMIGQVAGFQCGQERGHKKAGIGPHESDSMPRRQHGQRLREKLSHAVGRPRMPGPQGGP